MLVCICVQNANIYKVGITSGIPLECYQRWWTPPGSVICIWRMYIYVHTYIKYIIHINIYYILYIIYYILYILWLEILVALYDNRGRLVLVFNILIILCGYMGWLFTNVICLALSKSGKCIN